MAINDLLQTKSPMSIAFYLLLAGTSLIAISYYYRLKRQNVNTNIPYIGERPGFWPDIRAKSKWISSSEELLKEGWEQVYNNFNKTRGTPGFTNHIISMEVPLSGC